ncbi:MAG: EpsI family protein [Rhodobacteraceae bacterium]|nr:EpsI family protein [Paracoccaceae bacterium]
MNRWLRNFILLALMLAASGMAAALRPTHKIAEQGPKVDLEAMIPRSFGEWREDTLRSLHIVDPQQKEMLDKIYNQLLTRTYINVQGYRVMLSIAYGSDQSDTMQVHRPELCYPAQGFTLHEKNVESLALHVGNLPITRIATSLGPRQEPVSYWITIGDRAVRSGVEKKLVEMSYGLAGKIPDGILVRVSSIDDDKLRAYEMHDRFSKQMLEALAPEAQQRLAGNLEPQRP